MSRLLVVVLIALGFVFGARALLQLAARRFRGTLAGQLLESFRKASQASSGRSRGGERNKVVRSLSKCAECGDHVPTDSTTPSPFVCDSCRSRAARS